ncbi:MAG: hypothetical protein QM760_13985 [Nibricoccus sp.]
MSWEMGVAYNATREKYLSLEHGLRGVAEIGKHTVFYDIAHGADFEADACRLVVVVTGQEDDSRAGVAPEYLACCLQAVHARHVDVGDDEVVRVHCGGGDQLFAIRNRCDYVASLPRENEAKAMTHEVVVVRY